MHIYIDESGSFTTFQGSRSSISCVAALVIPKSVHDRLLIDFQTLIQAWGFTNSEIKGRQLSERHFDETISTVYNTQRAFLRIAAIDMGIHTQAMIKDHQKRQAERLRGPMDGRFSPSLVEQVYAVASQIQTLSPQLYVELVLLTQLVVSVIQTSTLVFSQLEPPALSCFSWRIDAKDRRLTKHEELWKTLVLPFIQSQTLRSQMIFMREGNYSYFTPFENADLPMAPDYLRDAVAQPSETFSSFSVNRIMADLEFVDSHSSLGVQLVDVLASCFRRASNQRLQRQGWQNLGKIIVRDPRTDLALEIGSLSDGVPRFYPFQDMPYAQTLDEIAKTSRGYLIRRK
jgi:Protein of unknown function (DUF3800)